MKTTTEKNLSRFVVLFHAFPPRIHLTSHWDLMLEQDGRLLTWSLPESPEPGKTISAKRLPDHRIEYLDYEGPVSGDRGSVSRVLKGTYCWQTDADLHAAILNFESHRWKLEFQTGQESKLLIKVSELID